MPTMKEWTELQNSVQIAMAKTIVKNIKQGKRPPELDFFDGEKEDVLTKAMIEESKQKMAEMELKNQFFILAQQSLHENIKAMTNDMVVTSDFR